MVFYVSLFLVSLIVASIVLWFYRIVVQATRQTYKSILPSAHENRRAAAVNGMALTRQAMAGQPAPWGWKSGAAKNSRSVGVPAYSRAGNANVGWPYRKEPFADATLSDVRPGSTVVKTRKITKGGIDKPWGW
jgi:hypothetical protein